MSKETNHQERPTKEALSEGRCKESNVGHVMSKETYNISKEAYEKGATEGPL